jgi:DNA-binding CsgD family transcriptional regulator
MRNPYRLDEGGTPQPDAQPGSRSALAQRFSRKHQLSRRETEVIELAAGGLSTKEIGAQLGCSQQTVAVYWSRIYRKVGCCSHAQVMARLLATALTPEGDEHGDKAGDSEPSVVRDDTADLGGAQAPRR